MSGNDENLLWMEALAGVDMGLTLGVFSKCVSIQKALLDWCEESGGSLSSAWRAIYGVVPPLIHEVLNVRKLNVSEMALLLGRTRMTFLALSRNDSNRAQIRAAATERTICDYPEYRQRGYIRTHAKLCESEVLSSDVAAGVAYCMHAPPTSSANSLDCRGSLDIEAGVFPSDADHLSLPQVYLGVDIEGGLVLLDACRGASRVKVANRVPHDWCVRVSDHTNMFLTGDSTSALCVNLNEGRSSAMDVPVSLPRYPSSGAYEVENRWVVWKDESSGKPRAFEWRDGTARMCSSEDAALHASSRVILSAQGNRVWAGSTCIATLPPSESITVVMGNAFAFDAFTQQQDWWRVDVRENKAWVVGLPEDSSAPANIICSVAPVVAWNV
jgi:hypothetical protein